MNALRPNEILLVGVAGNISALKGSGWMAVNATLTM